MTRALIDVPRSLDVHAWYVGAPRTRRASGVHSPGGATDGTMAYRHQAVRECLDVIGVLRDYRAPEPGETWLTPAASEQRLLTQINAIISLGEDALEQVIGLATNPDVPDPSRVFAATLVLGCSAGPKWVERIREIFVRSAERDVAEASAAVEACALSPSSDLDPVLQTLSEHGHVRVRAGAIRAWAFRDTLPEANWHAAMADPEPEVVLGALQARLGRYDRTDCERALEPWYRSENRALAQSALRAGVGLRLRSARAAAIEIVRRDATWADAALSLAMLGSLGDARLIREVLTGPGVRAGIVAAGILGSVELVSDLVALLPAGEATPAVRRSSAQAITIITGIPATEDNHEVVTSLWQQRAPSFNSRVRYRAGEPLTAQFLLRVLQAAHLSRRERQEAYLELVAMTESQVPRFSPHDFVGVQRRSIAAIERWLAHDQRGPSTN